MREGERGGREEREREEGEREVREGGGDEWSEFTHNSQNNSIFIRKAR